MSFRRRWPRSKGLTRRDVESNCIFRKAFIKAKRVKLKYIDIPPLFSKVQRYLLKTHTNRIERFMQHRLVCNRPKYLVKRCV